MAIQLRNVSKAFPGNDSSDAVAVVADIDLDVPDGGIVAMFGPNGCGKTTLLNIIAGIEVPDRGEVVVSGAAPDRLKVGYVFQNYRDTLLPWADVLDNVAFGLRATGLGHASARKHAAAFLEQHGVNLPCANYAYQLSVGQQQTVTLMRTLIQNPRNVLFDEPFSALDHKARFRMQQRAAALVQSGDAAALVVSHDVDECLYLSGEFVLLSQRPARIVKRFPVPFAYPRPPELLASAEFAALRREIVAAFLKEVEA